MMKSTRAVQERPFASAKACFPPTNGKEEELKPGEVEEKNFS